jgi:hypothetical protein
VLTGNGGQKKGNGGQPGIARGIRS